MRASIAVVFILAMLFLYGGLYQYLQFTTTSDNISAGEYQSLIHEPAIPIPTTLFMLIDENTDTTVNAERLVDRANQILSQAAVEMRLDGVEEIQLSGTNISGFRLVRDPTTLRELLPMMDADRLNVVIAGGLGGVNGVAFSGQQVVAVAEYTTSYDFRVLAHEVGHALGLDHVRDRSNLMYSGSSGTELRLDQATQAYEAAASFGAGQ